MGNTGRHPLDLLSEIASLWPEHGKTNSLPQRHCCTDPAMPISTPPHSPSEIVCAEVKSGTVPSTWQKWLGMENYWTWLLKPWTMWVDTTLTCSKRRPSMQRPAVLILKQPLQRLSWRLRGVFNNKTLTISYNGIFPHTVTVTVFKPIVNT